MTQPQQTYVLDAARDTVYSRPETHGEPEDSFARIAALWSGYLDEPDLSAIDVASMMILLKIARNREGHYRADNWIDVAGYAECGGRLDPTVEIADSEPAAPSPGGPSVRSRVGRVLLGVLLGVVGWVAIEVRG